MKHLEFESPQVGFAVWWCSDAKRGNDCRNHHLTLIRMNYDRMSASDRVPDWRIDNWTRWLSNLGLLVHDAGRHVIVTAGTCDVEGPWRRARPATRAHHVQGHANAARRVADRQARSRARRVREAARDAVQPGDEDLAAFTM